mgnify:CR=1 FL=1
MNLYADLVTLKANLGITDLDHDGELLRLLNAASRHIEQFKLAGRLFYVWEGVKYFDGAGRRLWLPDDLLSASPTVQLDEDGDATYEVTMAATDYYSYPLNAYPKIWLEINPQGDYGGFAPGINKGVKITGVWGWADSATPYETSGDTCSADMTAAQTTVGVADGGNFAAGQTIRIESEQCYVESILGNTLTIQRGVNGTTAATHASGKTIYIYTYPQDIVQATLITAMRAWKRKDSAYADVIGAPETGQIIMSKGIDPDTAALVAGYRRQRYI